MAQECATPTSPFPCSATSNMYNMPYVHVTVLTSPLVLPLGVIEKSKDACVLFRTNQQQTTTQRLSRPAMVPKAVASEDFAETLGAVPS